MGDGEDADVSSSNHTGVSASIAGTPEFSVPFNHRGVVLFIKGWSGFGDSNPFNQSLSGNASAAGVFTSPPCNQPGTSPVDEVPASNAPKSDPVNGAGSALLASSRTSESN